MIIAGRQTDRDVSAIGMGRNGCRVLIEKFLISQRHVSPHCIARDTHGQGTVGSVVHRENSIDGINPVRNGSLLTCLCKSFKGERTSDRSRCWRRGRGWGRIGASCRRIWQVAWIDGNSRRTRRETSDYDNANEKHDRSRHDDKIPANTS